jgi:hypothetical protein
MSGTTGVWARAGATHRVEVSRTIGADPASVALLLAGPAMAELWPDAATSFAAPVRSGFRFVVDFTVDAGAGTARGVITIAPGPDGPRGAAVRLVIPRPAPEAELAVGAARFLDELAAVAQSRASAA